MRSPAHIAVLVALAVLAVLAGARFVPWLTSKQDVELSSPTTPPLNTGLTVVTVKPRQVLCVNAVDLGPSYHSAHLLVAGPATLALTLSAPGFSSTSRAVTRADAFPLAIPVRMPRGAVLGQACVRNDGSAPFQLEGNVEPRTQSRPGSTLDGKAIQPQVPISFWRGKRETRIAALIGGIPHMAVFKPVGAWFFWIVLVLVLVAVPAAVITALALGMRET